jgi:hypothetical protein
MHTWGFKSIKIKEKALKRFMRNPKYAGSNHASDNEHASLPVNNSIIERKV